MHMEENVASTGGSKEEITDSLSTRQKPLNFHVPWLAFQELRSPLSHSHNKKEAGHTENQLLLLDVPEN